LAIEKAYRRLRCFSHAKLDAQARMEELKKEFPDICFHEFMFVPTFKNIWVEASRFTMDCMEDVLA